MAPIALLASFGDTWPVLALYLPAVVAVVHVGTLLLRPYMEQQRAMAWAYSFGSALVIALLMFGWSWVRLSRIEYHLGSGRLGTFHGWEPEVLWDVLKAGWVIGFVVSFAAYALLTRSTARRTAATAA